MGVSYSSVPQWVVNCEEKCTKFWSPLVWPLQPLLMQNQDTWDMGMDMGWEVSALELVSTPQDQSMSPDLPKDVASAVLSQDILVLGMDMDMASEVLAEVLVFTQPDLFMSPDLPRVLASAVLSLAILVMALPPTAMLLEVSALE